MVEIALPLIGGLILLVLGGELLVRGAVQIATRLGVSPLVIGLTLVGFGTSTPELVTSVQAALSGSPGIAYGNVVGSNIANILLILGASAMLTPILVTSNALKRDCAVMVAVALVFAATAALMPLGPVIGILFVAALALYIFTAFWQERQRPTDDHGAVYDKTMAAQAVDPALVPVERPTRPLVISLFVAVAGLGLVVLGGYFLVGGAVTIAMKAARGKGSRCWERSSTSDVRQYRSAELGCWAALRLAASRGPRAPDHPAW